jgi:hypothetical protein
MGQVQTKRARVTVAALSIPPPTRHPHAGGVEAFGAGADKGLLSEAAALQLSQQVSNQLEQTPAAIAKHAVQKAIDLFI